MDERTLGMNVLGRCRGRSVWWLVDTEASTSLLSLDVWRSLEGEKQLEPTESRMTAADGHEMVVHGTVEVMVDFGECCLPLRVTVVEMQPEAILGMDAMCRWGANVNTKRREIEVEDGVSMDNSVPPICLQVQYRNPAVEVEGAESPESWPVEVTAGETLEQGQGRVVQDTLGSGAVDTECDGVGQALPARCLNEFSVCGSGVENLGVHLVGGNPVENSMKQGESELPHMGGRMRDRSTTREHCRVLLTRDIVVPGCTTVMLPVNLEGDTKENQVLEGTTQFQEKTGLLVSRVFVPAGQDVATMEVTNMGRAEVKLYQKTRIGTGAELAAASKSIPGSVQMVRSESTLEMGAFANWVEAVVTAMPKEATPEEWEQVKSMLCRRKQAFKNDPTDTGCTEVVTHKIDTGDHPPIRQRFRRIPPERRQVVEVEIQKMLDRGIIEPSHGPWASPIVLVKKMTGEWRFCIDYRKLNDITKKDAYPLPRIDDTLDLLSRAQYFATIDLASGYWQVSMDPADKEKTAVCTH